MGTYALIVFSCVLLNGLCGVRMGGAPSAVHPFSDHIKHPKKHSKWETGYEAADSTGAGHFAYTKGHNNTLVVTYLFEHTILIILLWS